ncbi:pleckstrin homology domain-containing family M member 2 isoform X1 [Leptopilina heterotoma]|uniref:pleckstrin homology domain-containing family M member 2 isoform X1 n=2 Tax=Leptopilina heterotoma TaxID=63436 RepID=UPI001CA8463C|nr:pleckstrin homology domain-containing family M member 2 isoform X1 [Leptopilina heterotoma]XP_043483129.1 pleckstrin homology domain-containing family M member 2 isoform X1 [Leptopilina heterotoma]XP_043483130.1 pleckstrin homology domain-containing family M member 2 isoform X1 [Leptopilina heterotoma]
MRPDCGECSECVSQNNSLKLEVFSCFSKEQRIRKKNNVNSITKMPGQEDIDLCTDKVLSKSRILQELTKAIKLVYAQSLHGSVVLDGDSWLVYWLDRALRHGLRIERHGYWGTARELSHQDTVVVIHALQNVLTSIGKGRAWLYHTLSEGSFESYLACLLRDTHTLKKQYFPHALVRNPDKTNQLINLLAGLENVSFTLQLDVTYLDIVNYMPQRPMSGSPSGTALTLHLRSSSFSPSLVSPGDSGVALDSDMDLSNETDGSSCREDSSIEDIPRYRNSKYKTILSNCTKDIKNMDRSFSSSDSGEEGKTPVQSPGLKTKFQKTLVTNSDIVNQNLPQKLDDNEMNCSSLDTLKDYSYYSKSLEESKFDKVNNDFDNVSNGINRYSYYGDNNGYSFKKNIDPRNSYVINNDTNLLELSMTISDCDSTEAPYSILNTINMVDTSILSTSTSETVVQRRQRKKKRGEGKKRVSFHEDIFKMMKLDDDENYEDYGYRSSSYNKQKDVQPERYSWCANDSPYPKETLNTRNAYSEYYSSSSSLSTHDSENERRLTPKLCNHPVCQKNYRCTCLSISERGVPEGQEDPQMEINSKLSRPKMEIDLKDNEAQEAYIVEKEYGNIVEDPPVKLEMPPQPKKSSDISDADSVTTCDSEESKKNRHLASPQKKRNMTAILSGENSKLLIPPPLRQAPSKTSLLNRFLRSITERKFDVNKSKKAKSNQLYIKCGKIDQDSFKEFNQALEKEIRDNQDPEKRRFSGEKISLKQKEIFKGSIYRDKTEQLYKVYKVRSSYMTNGESKPMLALLTDKTLYLTSSKSDHSYRNQFVIPYNELDVIMIGPNAQTILISNADNEMQYLFSTGSAETTWELIAHLEMAMRRSPSKPRLPAVRELSYDDMHSLRHSILAETAVNLEEKIEHYNIIYMEDEHISPPSTPCGPTKEGDLMFRPHTYQTQHPNAPTNAWEAGYFVLKGGVVYMFTDSSQRLPKRAIPLKGGLCQGCRRIPNSHRPHTFEILLKSNKSFQFAAPDEYVASEWLQSFVQSASGLFDSCEKREPLPCSLVVSSRHLIAINEVFPGTQRGQILSCASIQDLTALRMPLTHQSWCVLEFACREVHESSGDWVVYFTNYAEFCTFRKILETLWNNVHEENFPVTTIQPEDKLHQRCTGVSKDLENAWQYLLPVAPE